MSLETTKSAAHPSVPTRKTIMKWLALPILAPAVVFWPEHAWAALRFSLENLLIILPVILLGLALSAGIQASGSMALIAAAFQGRPLRMIFLAALIGALTPVCGVSVLPLVAGLLAGGVPLAPIMAFWLSSPITDPGMLAVTAGTLGLDFAIGKTASAFAVGLFGGSVTALCIGLGWFHAPAKPSLTDYAGTGTCGSEGGCDSTSNELLWRFWRQPARRRIFTNICLSNGRLMLVWLFFAFSAEYALQQILPPGFIGLFAGGGDWWAVPAAAVVGAPIYLDGYAALPLIRGLIDGGMDLGAAMAFLIAGGITSAWAAIPVFALVRLPVFFFYLVMAVLSAMLSGWAFGFAVG